MSGSKNARVGLMVLGLAVVAVVAVLVWRFQGDDSADGAEQQTAQVQKKGVETQGGNEAKPPPPPRRIEPLPPPLGGESLHDRIGGRPGIRVLTGSLLDAVVRNEEIMATEGAGRVNVRVLQGHLIDFVCKETGGPCEYTAGSVKDALGPLELTAAQWAVIEKAFADTLAEMKVPDQEAQELMAVFGELERDVVTAP